MSSNSATATTRDSRTPKWLRHPLLAPLNDRRSWDRVLQLVNPLWSLTEVRAEVTAVVAEAPGVTSLWLKPNARFLGFRAGQHVLLELDIDGVRQARCFSLSHAPRTDGLLRLTIKRKQGGLVSAAAQNLRPGQIVNISQAMGEFAPTDGNASLLLMSAGSGITPMLALLHDLANSGSGRDVVLLHSSRSDADQIAAGELRDLASRWASLKVIFHHSGVDGHLKPQRLATLVSDWATRELLLCGPDGFTDMVEGLVAAAGLPQKVQVERFGRRPAPIDAQAPRHAVTAEQTKQVFTAASGQSLLEAAEAAGLKPRFGCRRGICRTCQCRKLSGTVTNELTGQVSGAGEELIQLCISTPLSAIELAL